MSLAQTTFKESSLQNRKSKLTHMSTYNKVMNWILWKVVYLLKDRTRIIYTDGQKYLLRVYLKEKGILPRMFIHHFLASDGDRDLHNHPWGTSKSFIIAGSYKETRLAEDRINKITKIYKPGMINTIGANDFHRVELQEGSVWTLFMPGKKTQSWGFWNVEQQKFVPSMIYIPENNNEVRDLDGNLVELED